MNNIATARRNPHLDIDCPPWCQIDHSQPFIDACVGGGGGPLPGDVWARARLGRETVEAAGAEGCHLLSSGARPIGSTTLGHLLGRLLGRRARSPGRLLSRLVGQGP